MGWKKSAKILIVGDNPQLSGIVAKKKTLSKSKPICVRRSEEALQAASRRSPFDLLFTDIMTPKVNGEDFAKLFTELSPKTKIIYMIP